MTFAIQVLHFEVVRNQPIVQFLLKDTPGTSTMVLLLRLAIFFDSCPTVTNTKYLVK